MSRELRKDGNLSRDRKNPSVNLKPREQLSKNLLPRANSFWKTPMIVNPSFWTAMSRELRKDGMTQRTKLKADLPFYKTLRMPGLAMLKVWKQLSLNSIRQMKRLRKSRNDSTWLLLSKT